jgi:hypothetical protein
LPFDSHQDNNKSTLKPDESNFIGFKGSRVYGASEMLKSFKELKVWQKSYNLCLRVYKMTTTFPKEERYGLTAQIRRSSVSIPSNIAEDYDEWFSL